MRKNGTSPHDSSRFFSLPHRLTVSQINFPILSCGNTPSVSAYEIDPQTLRKIFLLYITVRIPNQNKTVTIAIASDAFFGARNGSNTLL